MHNRLDTILVLDTNGQSDRIGKKILHCAYYACWCAMKINQPNTVIDSDRNTADILLSLFRCFIDYCYIRFHAVAHCNLKKNIPNNKLCGSHHNMPPPLSSLCEHWSASRCRADHACRRSSRLPQSIHSHAHHCSCLTH